MASMCGCLVVVCWSHDERRVKVKHADGVVMWEMVSYDEDGRGWIETNDGWVCVYA